MKILGVIPARYASTRFPGKPLTVIGGITMIERVYRQAKAAANLSGVVVATDDLRIANHVSSFGGEVMMTSPDHPSGTDRCAETLDAIEGYWDGVINIQGDEPFILPDQINLAASVLMQDDVQIATLVKVIQSSEELFNPNSPKVVLSTQGDALYFSRQAIPFIKGIETDAWVNAHVFYKHIGIYAYRSDVLRALTNLPKGLLEQAESLEQLRWLEAGYRIRTATTDLETIAIDTPEDLKRAEAFLAAQPDK